MLDRGKLFFAPLAFVVLCLSPATAAWADTVPITFSFSGGAILTSPPTPTAGSVLTTSGFISPFGGATYNEIGIVTFTTFPPNIFQPISAAGDFTVSLNSGAGTFSGTSSVTFSPPNATGAQTTIHALTIMSGTGIFSGATGLATATGLNSPPPGPDLPSPVSFSGGGTITAPGITPVPEPTTMLLLGTGLAGVVAKARKKRKANKSEEV